MFGKKKLGHILWPVFFKLNWQWNQKKKVTDINPIQDGG